MKTEIRASTIFLSGLAFAIAIIGIIAIVSIRLNAATITANVVVSGVCEESFSPTNVVFGAILPNGNHSTNIIVTSTNNGNEGAYIFISGGNWIDTSNALISFGSTNTLWNAIAQTSYNGIGVSLTPSNTQILVPAGSSANIYFGLAIPGGQYAGTYNQLITIDNTC
ncbi:hypothetical protein M1394_01855 [Candidatus Marsarchaeota archaeon]|nr:hypothetical protein [Candidatus Marsarchaeota archaeon]